MQECKEILPSAQTYVMLQGFGWNKDKAKIFWQHRSGDRCQLQEKEISLKEAGGYMTVAAIAQGEGNHILAIVNSVDHITDLEDYVGEDKDQGLLRRGLTVYAGDVFCCFNRERDSYWGDPRSNGLYLATATG